MIHVTVKPGHSSLLPPFYGLSTCPTSSSCPSISILSGLVCIQTPINIGNIIVSSLRIRLYSLAIVWVIDGHQDMYHHQKRIMFSTETVHISLPGTLSQDHHLMQIPFSIDIPNDLPSSLSKQVAYDAGLIGEGSGDFGLTYFLEVGIAYRKQVVIMNEDEGVNLTSNGSTAPTLGRKLTRMFQPRVASDQAGTTTTLNSITTTIPINITQHSLIQPLLILPGSLSPRNERNLSFFSPISQITLDPRSAGIIIPNRPFNVSYKFNISKNNNNNNSIIIKSISFQLIQSAQLHLHGASESKRCSQRVIFKQKLVRGGEGGVGGGGGRDSKWEGSFTINIDPLLSLLPSSDSWPGLIDFSYHLYFQIHSSSSSIFSSSCPKIEKVWVPVKLTSLTDAQVSNALQQVLIESK